MRENNTWDSCTYTITFLSYWWYYIISTNQNFWLNTHNLIFTRPLTVKWCSYTLDNAQLSSGLYIISLSGPYFSCGRLLYIHSLFLNGNVYIISHVYVTVTYQFPNNSETVFSIENHRVFSNKSTLYYHARAQSIFVKSGRPAIPIWRIGFCPLLPTATL